MVSNNTIIGSFTPSDIHNTKSQHQRTTASDTLALIVATYNGDVTRAISLLNSKTDPNKSTNYGKRTPLHYLSMGTENVILLAELLMLYKADIDAKDRDNNTPLHTALLHDKFPLATTLINAKASLTIPNISGATPLHISISRDQTPAVKELLAAKAPINTQDNHGNTPLHVAISYGHKGASVMSLIESKASLTTRNNFGHNVTQHIIYCYSKYEEQNPYLQMLIKSTE